MRNPENGLLVLFILHSCSGESNRSASKVISGLLDSSNYESRVRPLADEGQPVDVYVNVNIIEISSINEVDMEYSMTCYISQTWIDNRLNYEEDIKSIPINYNNFDQVWTPDLYIKNSKAVLLHDDTIPNRHVRIFKDGIVFYGQHLSSTIVCSMILDRFPLDNQTCYFDLSSFTYYIDDLVYRWNTNVTPIELSAGFSLPEYEITGTSYESCESTLIAGDELGSLPCLRGLFYLKRRLKAYILSTYLPSLLVVFLSWLSFWIDPESTPARTSLSILTILTITTQSSTLAKGSPAGSFTKASDFWMAACLAFVFAAFIEYSIVNTLLRKKQPQTCDTINEEDIVFNHKMGKKFLKKLKKKILSDPAMAVEMTSRIAFPSLFAIFNIIYWSYYLIY